MESEIMNQRENVFFFFRSFKSNRKTNRMKKRETEKKQQPEKRTKEWKRNECRAESKPTNNENEWKKEEKLKQ